MNELREAYFVNDVTDTRFAMGGVGTIDVRNNLRPKKKGSDCKDEKFSEA